MTKDRESRERPGERNRSATNYRRRMQRLRAEARIAQQPATRGGDEVPAHNATVDCGWGRVLFGQTFEDPKELVAALRDERAERRDIAFYVRDPHVVVAHAPQEVFLDPSNTYRLELPRYRPAQVQPRGFTIRRLSDPADPEAVNRIYAARNMVAVPPEFLWGNRDSRKITVFLAEDEITGQVVGTVTGIDHRQAFGDPDGGSSLWCLAVDPQAVQPGIGEALVRRLAEHFAARGAQFMDLSVMHDNAQAIALYERIGFVRVPVFAVKRKNPINEALFTGPVPVEALNPYAKIIVDEARRRGIAVEIIDAPNGYFRLSHGGRMVMCREALCELTTAVAVSICDDKTVTRGFVERAGILVPRQVDADDADGLAELLKDGGSVVVKPARGEQGRGITVDVKGEAAVERAIEDARRHCEHVIVEEFVRGQDLRLVVIDYKVVAAATRLPPRVVGNGRHTVAELIARQSRRREKATGGESHIPQDEETERCVVESGHAMDEVLGEGVEVTVRRTANLHTGGTIHDVTDHVHSVLVDAAIKAARAINIPVVGIDLIVPNPQSPNYVFIEANERPGLANHEPQPTAQRFVDLLFPLSLPASVRESAA
ncbi:N-acetylglutaminylglutamine synthetase [Marinibaculum pumilum]|uniref:N-acetylglutaminylglutamine synthetase n=1 Tax=Marinibaculum pumilum TaxID=1766165 RepID=A0ABV7L1Z3_9PROT